MLALIALTLAAIPILVVIFSDYEGFVIRMDLRSHASRPDWQREADVKSLKYRKSIILSFTLGWARIWLLPVPAENLNSFEILPTLWDIRSGRSLIGRATAPYGQFLVE